MPNYECPDDCGKTYQSIKAALTCDCDKYDRNGYEKAPASNDRGNSPTRPAAPA